MTHPVLSAGRTAVVTGAAEGIGRAACMRFAAFGMNVCMTDIDATALEDSRRSVADEIGTDDKIMAHAADVASLDELVQVKDAVYERFGEVGLLMNNAATRLPAVPWEDYDKWRRTIDVNMWGVVNGAHAFVPAMIDQGTRCVVVNVGSKQGITNPPSNAPYNVAKAAVKTYTELLQHDLRNVEDCAVSAHLLIPGLTGTGRRAGQPGAWTPEQVVDFMIAALEWDNFYILCPDNEVTPEMDRQRILWSAGDITENRPALSRWHPDFAGAFEKFRP